MNSSATVEQPCMYMNNEHECMYEGGTMGNLSFPPQAKDLNQQYEDHYHKSRDIDGRLFFDGDETVLPSKVEM